MRGTLPTRVSTACERCRRHKSRCDTYRPCSLCVRANVDCQSRQIEKHGTDGVRKRTGSTRNTASRHSQRPQSSRITPEHPQQTDSSTYHEIDSSPVTSQPAEPPTDNDASYMRDSVHPMRPSIGYGDAESAMGIARKICEIGKQHIDERSTSAIPGYPVSASLPAARRHVSRQRVPISRILGRTLPPTDFIHEVLEDYFDSVHLFSLVIYEPKFRRKLASIADGLATPSQRPFLVLLSTMLGMAAWYRSQRAGVELNEEKEKWRKYSSDFLSLTEEHLVELMDQHSITAAQVFILLGSHHVYHGRPNLSFSLLGATIKIAQALGLHREPLRGELEDIEERKRVWWTIYTWDRFASITYGRPLGINDKDCNVGMPIDVFENPAFVAPNNPEQSICYSMYQRELNKLYLIASPALETIFGSRASPSTKSYSGDSHVKLVKHITVRLHDWRHKLPSHLLLDLEKDFSTESTLESRAHALQGLALQLTFDNLLIVLHRPFLAQQVDYLSANQQTPSDKARDFSHISNPQNPSPESHLSPEVTSPTSISDPWLSAAVRTSRVTELPVLAQLATDSHLVAFLAVNLFNAAIVLAIIAISDPLSDTAQVMKRTITRVFRLQDLLGKRSTLSKQSTSVLKNVINMLLNRESQAMLAPVTGPSQKVPDEVMPTRDYSTLMSVEDTLRLPLDAGSGNAEGLHGASDQQSNFRNLRLTEGLSSVQNVFAPPTERPFYPDLNEHGESLSGVSNQHPYDGWELPSPYNWNNADVTQTGVDENYFDSGESGLYWLWDMTWSGLNN